MTAKGSGSSHHGLWLLEANFPLDAHKIVRNTEARSIDEKFCRAASHTFIHTNVQDILPLFHQLGGITVILGRYRIIGEALPLYLKTIKTFEANRLRRLQWR